MPLPVRLQDSTHADNSMDNLLVSIRGVGTGIFTNRLGRLTVELSPLSSGGLLQEPIRVTMTTDDSERHPPYLDADVLVTGVLLAVTDVQGAFQGFSLSIPNLSAFKILRSASRLARRQHPVTWS